MRNASNASEHIDLAVSIMTDLQAEVCCTAWGSECQHKLQIGLLLHASTSHKCCYIDIWQACINSAMPLRKQRINHLVMARACIGNYREVSMPVGHDTMTQNLQAHGLQSSDE